MAKPKMTWTPEARARASAQAKARWEALPESVRELRKANRRAAYEAKYPERVELSDRVRAQIDSGELVPGPCQDCGRPEAAPEYDYTRLELVGWSHYACRKARTR